MAFELIPYKDENAQKWDVFCNNANQSTFLHTRRFLSYHKDRFQDKSLFIECEGNLRGLFPAAVHPEDNRCIVSHPGITYGGVLHQSGILGEKMIHVFSEICAYYARKGYQKIIYKPVPTFYHTVPSQDDLYAIFRLNGNRFRCDLSSIIDLDCRRTLTQRRKRALKKGLSSGVRVEVGNQHLPSFWNVLSTNLKEKHNISPVHTKDEINLLSNYFPDNINCVVGILENSVVAGVLLFITNTAVHAQYIASSSIGSDLSALDVVFDYCIQLAINLGKRWFNFGISTENGGRLLNEGLYTFKSEFGGGGFVHEFYEINL